MVLPDSAKIQLQCYNCPNGLGPFLHSGSSLKEAGNKISNYIQNPVQDVFLKEFMDNSNLDTVIYDWLLLILQDEGIKDSIDSPTNLNLFSHCFDRISDQQIYVKLRETIAEKCISDALDKLVDELQSYKLERICIHSFIDLHHLLNLQVDTQLSTSPLEPSKTVEGLISFIRQNLPHFPLADHEHLIRSTWLKLEDQGRLLLTYKSGNRGYFLEFKILLGIVLESPLQIIKVLFPTSGSTAIGPSGQTTGLDIDPLEFILAPSNRQSLDRWIKQRGPSTLLKNQEDLFNQQNYLRNHTGREATKLTLQDRRNQIQRVESNIDVKQISADATKLKIETRLAAIEEEKRHLLEHLVTVNDLIDQLSKDQAELKSLGAELDETETKLDSPSFNPIPIIQSMETLTAQREKLCMASLYHHDDPSIDIKLLEKLSTASLKTFERIHFVDFSSTVEPLHKSIENLSIHKSPNLDFVPSLFSLSPSPSPLPSPSPSAIPILPPDFVDPFRTASPKPDSSSSKGKGKGKATEVEETDYSQDQPILPTLPLKRERRRQKSRTPSLVVNSNTDNINSNTSSPHGSRSSTPTFNSNGNGNNKTFSVPDAKRIWVCCEEFHARVSSSKSTVTPPYVSTWDYAIRPSASIDLDVENSLSELFLLAYQLSIDRIQAGQITNIIDSTAPVLLIEMFKEGLNPKGLLEGALSESRVGLEIANKIVKSITTLEFSSNVARYAIRSTFFHVIEVIQSFCFNLASRPCMCFLAAHPFIIELAMKKIISTPPSVIEYVPTDGKLTEACRALVASGELIGAEWNLNDEELMENVEGAYKVLFNLIKNTVMNVKPHSESVLALIRAQGGASTWEMARKYRRASSAGITVKDEEWPIKCWETITMRHLERKIYSNISVHSAQASKAGHKFLTSRDLPNALQAWDFSIILHQGGEAAMLYALRAMTTSHFSLRISPPGPLSSASRSDITLQLYNTRESYLDATIALALSPGLPAAKGLVDSCIDTMKFLRKSQVETEKWTCPPGTCTKGSSTTTINTKVYKLLNACIRDLFGHVFHRVRLSDRSQTLTEVVIEATTAAFDSAIKKGQLEKFLANPTSFVRKFGELDRRLAIMNSPLEEEQENKRAQTLLLLSCKQVALQLITKEGTMPCLCDLASPEGISKLRSAYQGELDLDASVFRLQASVETYADEFCQELCANGVGIEKERQTIGAEVRDAFDRGTEVLWKLIDKKSLKSLTTILPECLDGITLFKTISLSTLDDEEESIGVVEDCRAWAVRLKHIEMGKETEFQTLISKGNDAMKAGDYKLATSVFSLGVTPIITSRVLLVSRACSVFMLPASNRIHHLSLIIRDMTTAIQLDISNPIPYALRGKALFSKKLFAEAIIDLDNAFNLDPRDYTSHRLATHARMRIKDPLSPYGSYIQTAAPIEPTTEYLTNSISYILDPSPEDLDDNSEPPPLESLTDEATKDSSISELIPSRLQPSLSSSTPLPHPSPKILDKKGKSTGTRTPNNENRILSRKVLKRRTPIFACPPDRHFNGISAEPENLPEVDEILSNFFLSAYKRGLIIVRGRQLAFTRETLFYEYLKGGTEWFTANFDTVAGRNEITRDIMSKMKNIFTQDVLCGYSSEAWRVSTAQVLETLRQLTYNEEIPCICVLSRPAAFNRLRRILEKFQAAMETPPSVATVQPLDYDALHSHCKAEVKSGELSGPIWRSATKYKMKVAQLAKVFVDVFQIVVGINNVNSRDIEYSDIAKLVGGVEAFGMAQRYENYTNLKSQCHEDEEEPIDNIYASWMLFSSLPIEYFTGVDDDTPVIRSIDKHLKYALFEEEPELLIEAADRLKKLADESLRKLNFDQAIDYLLGASICDPTCSKTRSLLATCRSIRVGRNEASQCVADASIAIVLMETPDCEIYYTRMRALRTLGLLKDAISDYTKGIAIDPNKHDHIEPLKKLTAEFEAQELMKKNKGKEVPIQVNGGGKDENQALIKAMVMRRT